MLNLRDLTPEDGPVVLPMAEAFYHSDAVDHPVPFWSSPSGRPPARTSLCSGACSSNGTGRRPAICILPSATPPR